MGKRTTPSDAIAIVDAADLEDLVQDKRAGWRASGAKARRRQRRYKNLLTHQLIKTEFAVSEPDIDQTDE